MSATKKKTHTKRGLPVIFLKYKANTNAKIIVQKKWTQGASTASSSHGCAGA